MLIESDKILEGLKDIIEEARERTVYFSMYQAICDNVELVRDLIAKVEVEQAEINTRHKYVEALTGLKDK